MSDKASSADNQQERFLVRLEPTYIVGLIDGEGYFSVLARRKKQRNWILNDVRFTFGVKLKEEDGKAILKELQKFFECGKLYYRKDSRAKFCNCYEYQVSTHKEIFGTIIPFFSKHQLRFPSKRKTFKIFCKIAEMVKNKEHLQEGGIKKIRKLSKTMH